VRPGAPGRCRPDWGSPAPPRPAMPTTWLPERPQRAPLRRCATSPGDSPSSHLILPSSSPAVPAGGLIDLPPQDLPNSTLTACRVDVLPRNRGPTYKTLAIL